MKNTILVSALLCLFHTILIAQWTSLNGPYGGDIWQLKANNDFVFAAKANGLHRSADAGLTWEKCGKAIYSVLALDNQNLLQFNWANAQSTFSYSSDNGDHWQNLPLPDSIPYVGDYAILGDVILFSSQNKLWRSSDFGQHWTGFQVPGEVQHYYSYLENIGDRFYLGNQKRLLSSTNGADWTLVSPNVPGGPNAVISKIYVHDTLLFSYADGVLARSANGGQFWQLADGPFEHFTPSFAAIADTLFAGIGNKLIRSIDQGLTWDFVNPAGPTIDLLTSFGSVLVGNIYYKGASRSTDFGQTFQSANNHLDGGDVYALSIKDQDLWLWDSEGVMRQDVQQFDWMTPSVYPAFSSGINQNWIYHFKNAVFLRQDHGDVFRSFDNGLSWSLVTPSSQAGFSHTTKFDYKNDTLFLVEDFGRVWQTTDLGEHWTLTNLTIEPQIGDNLWDLTVQGPNLFIAAGDHIYRSTDNMLSWDLVGDSMPFGGDVYWIRLFATPSHLLAWVDYERLFVSNNQGASWVEASIPFSPWFSQSYDDRTEFIEIGDKIIGFFQNGGVFVSKDQGAFWQDFNEGIPDPTTITDLTYSDSTMWLGTSYFGLFKRSIGDLPTVSTTQPLSKQNDLKIFPNPTHGTFSCKLPLEISGKATLTIFDLQGKQLLRRTDSREHLQNIDLSHCTKGVYWVSIVTPEGIFGGKVVLE